MSKACSLLVSLTLATSSTAFADSITARVGMDVGTDAWRNIPAEGQPLAVAPSIEVAIPVVEAHGAMPRLEVGVAGGASTGSKPLGQPNSLMGADGWDEIAGTVRVGATFPHEVQVSVGCTGFDTPNHTAKHLYEAWAGVGWNDAREGFWRGFAPSVTVAQEVSGTANGMSRGTYVGVLARPTFGMVATKEAQIDIAIPLEIDLSLDDYYDDATGDDTVGAMSAGVAVVTTLPLHFGTWSISATTRAIHFGPRMAALAGESTVLTMTGTVAVNF